MVGATSASTADTEPTLCSMLESWGRRGDCPAILAFHKGGCVTRSYGEIASAAQAFGRGLARRGLGRIEPVVICARNSPEWVIAYFGILCAGALPVPVNDLASRRELAQILAVSGARRIITTVRHESEFRALSPDVEIILIDGDGAEIWRPISDSSGTLLPRIGALDPASLLWTSGTTGVPKGVPLSHRNFIANIDALLSEQITNASDRVLLPLPLHHAYPFTVGLLHTFSVGAAVLLPSGITGPEITEAGRLGGATAIVGVPRLYAALFDAVAAGARARGRFAAFLFESLLTFSQAARRYLGIYAGRIFFAPIHKTIGVKIRLLASGGARLDPELGRRLEGLGYEVLTGYGLTETSPMLTMSPRGRGRVGAEGIPARGVALRIDAEPGQDFGEILATGPNVFSGYWKNEAATRAAFTADGWFRTGDLGFLDTDHYLHITGRKSEMIVLPGGEHVFPEEIEARYGSVAVLRELAVLEEAGKLVALVVPDESFIRMHGAARLEASLREELENASAALAPYQRISGFVLTRDALPRTHLGKVKRHLLPDLYARAKLPGFAAEEEISESDRKFLAEPLAAAIRDWLMQRYPGKRVVLDSMLQIDLGIDSLEWVTLTLELQQRLGIALTEQALSRIVTLRDLIAEAMAVAAVMPSSSSAPLAAASEIPETSPWLKPQGPFLRLLGFVLYHCNRALMRAAFGITVEGLERVPIKGPLVLAPNHASLLDAFLVAAALPFARLQHAYWAGWTGYLFGNRLRRFFSRVARVVPMDPDRTPAEGLAFGLAALARGEALVWFPEGRRTRTGEIGPFLRGVGYLLARTRVPAVPVRLVGSFHARWWHSRVAVIFGDPMIPDELESAGAGADSFARIADALRSAVVALEPRKKDGN